MAIIVGYKMLLCGAVQASRMRQLYIGLVLCSFISGPGCNFYYCELGDKKISRLIIVHLGLYACYGLKCW